MNKINTFIQFLTARGFIHAGEGRYSKPFTGVKSNRPMSKSYTLLGKQVTREYRYEDTGELYKRRKTFSVDRIGYRDGKFYLTQTTQAMRNQAMRDLGLTMVRGPVSGKVYWE